MYWTDCQGETQQSVQPDAQTTNVAWKNHHIRNDQYTGPRSYVNKHRLWFVSISKLSLIGCHSLAVTHWLSLISCHSLAVTDDLSLTICH